jgi:Tol biopolymer transport system component
MKRRTAAVAAVTLILAVASNSTPPDAARAETCTHASCFSLVSTIAFTSTRDNPTANPLLAAEIYLMNPDGTSPRRLTNNSYGDGFPTLSPDGTEIVFDSNRLTAGSECGGVMDNNVDDLFLMDADGSGQTFLARGSSATWSPDGKNVAFHASASYYASGGLLSGCPIRTDPGSATSDSDIFAANVDDLLAGAEQPANITNSPGMIDDDPDWSPDGQKIVFTSHPVTDEPRFSNQTELYVMHPDGSWLQRLTNNDYEERAPAWSPDGSRIVYSCRIGGATNPFRICVINADGTGFAQLTNEADSISDLTATWSPDGDQVLFHRRVPPDGQQLFVMTENPDGTWTAPAQLTVPPGVNNLAHWGQLRVKR